jgi:hypothetical protein
LTVVPMVVGSMIFLSRNTSLFSWNINKKSTAEEIIKTTGLSSLFFFSNKKIPNWIKFVGLYLIIFTILKIFPSISNYYVPLIYGFLAKVNLIWLKYTWLILLILILFYYIVNLFLYLRFAKNKIEISEYLPHSILSWLKEIKEISKSKHKGLYIEIYLRNILIYLVIILIYIYIFFIL